VRDMGGRSLALIPLRTGENQKVDTKIDTTKKERKPSRLHPGKKKERFLKIGREGC